MVPHSTMFYKQKTCYGQNRTFWLLLFLLCQKLLGIFALENSKTKLLFVPQENLDMIETMTVEIDPD